MALRPSRASKASANNASSNKLVSQGHLNRPSYRPVGKVEYVSSSAVERNRQLIFRFNVFAKTVGKTRYAQTVVFSKLEFVPKPDKLHPLVVEVGAGHKIYCVRVDGNKHPIQVRCSCPDYRWTWGWDNYEKKVMAGPNVPPYQRKTPPPPEGYPYRNPQHVIGPCKHIRACLKWLEKHAILSNLDGVQL